MVHHQWVKGHQDQHKTHEELSNDEKLNVQMDKAA